jgi:DNA-binding LacI/PurR family transcriptional regulator
MAQALATKKSHRIGAFVFDLDDWAPQRILAGAAKAARSAGLHPRHPPRRPGGRRVVAGTRCA